MDWPSLSDIANVFGGGDSKGSGGASIWPSIINAGTSLAGT